MKIESLELYGYKFLRFNHIRKIKVTMNSLIQIILGKNGSGKTKLLEECNPLPAVPANYEDKGYKKVVVTDNGHTYTLVSDFGKKKPHSFKKDDGEELNTGGTISVQRELVARHLGYTDELHAILTNKVVFTDMPPTKRREFLQGISDCDVTYALKIYKMLLTANRDAIGALKELKNTLSKEMGRLQVIETDNANVDRLVETLRGELDVLSREYDPTSNDSAGDVLKLLGELEDDLAVESSNVIRGIKEYNKFLKYQCSDEIDLELKGELQDIKYKTENKLSNRRGMLNNMTNQFENIQRLVIDIENSGAENLDELKQNRINIQNEVNGLTSKNTLFSFEGDVSNAVFGIGRLKTKLVDVLTDLPDNSDKRFSQTNKTTLEEIIERKTTLLNRINSRHTMTEERIEHIRNSEKSTCPDCGYTWIDGISPAELEKLTEELGKLHDLAKETAEQIKNATEERERIIEYGRTFNRFRAIFDDFPWASSLFDYMLEDGRIYNKPVQLIPLIDRYAADLNNHAEVWRLTLKLAAIDESIDRITSSNVSGDKNKLQEHLEDIESKIFVTQKETMELEAELKAVDNRISKMNKLIDMRMNIERTAERKERTLNEFNATLTRYVRASRNEHINALIKKHQLNLTMAMTKHNEANNCRSRIDGIRESLDDLKRRTDALKLILDALSPTTGLIAKAMNSFVYRFIDQLNVVINSIYTYPIEIMKPDTDEDGLTYKFPMVINDLEDNKPKDISEGSDGQKEVINFAFRLVTLMLMGRDNYPLLIDEIGRAQDEVHLDNLMSYIKTLASDQSRQIFLISHFASAHSSYTSADFIVLNKSNITVPNVSNEHVEIEY